jgi:hypothetical protein
MAYSNAGRTPANDFRLALRHVPLEPPSWPVGYDGELVFGDQRFCNEECARETIAYLEDSVTESNKEDP